MFKWLKKVGKKIGKFVKKNKNIINVIGWHTYHAFRKKKYSGALNQDLVKQIPLGAVGSVFGNNKLTQTYQEIALGIKNGPTHTMGYIGNGKQQIAEADIYWSLNTLSRYANKKTVFHWFKDMTVDELQEIKRRVYYLLKRKKFYDIAGYAGFVVRPLSKALPFLSKIPFLKASNNLPFCSDAWVIIYQGDPTSTDKEIRKWKMIRRIADVNDPDEATPAHIYLYMEKLLKQHKNIIGRVKWAGKK